MMLKISMQHKEKLLQLPMSRALLEYLGRPASANSQEEANLHLFQ